MKYSFSASHLHPTCSRRKNSQVGDKKIVRKRDCLDFFLIFVVLLYFPGRRQGDSGSRGEGAGGAGQARLRHQGSLLRAELTFTLQAIKRLSDERYLYTVDISIQAVASHAWLYKACPVTHNYF